jgi:hypothetical protein
MGIKDRIEYNPETGILSWKPGAGRKYYRGGPIAGNADKDGYIKVCVLQKHYRAHRLAWFLHYGQWPEGEIDHINGDVKDNSIKNLRIASRSQNAANGRRPKTNTSGFKGVTRVTSGSQYLWRAQIGINGKMKVLGWFSTPEEASACYQVAAKEAFGDFSSDGLKGG